MSYLFCSVLVWSTFEALSTFHVVCVFFYQSTICSDFRIMSKKTKKKDSLSNLSYLTTDDESSDDGSVVAVDPPVGAGDPPVGAVDPPVGAVDPPVGAVDPPVVT
jgi:hypothetical protein